MRLDDDLVEAMGLELSLVKSVLVTGATGVIGRSLISLMKELRLLGRFTGSIIAVSNSRTLSDLDSARGDQSFRGDLVDRKFVSSLPDADVVIHAASPSAPSQFMARPVETVLLNVDATLGLRSKAIRNFVFISTSEIYSGLNHPATEDEVGRTNTVHPRASYIESKRVGEVLTLTSNGKNMQNPKCTVFRVALAYGHEGVEINDSRLLYDLVRRAVLEGHLTFSGDGSMVRTYSFAPDIAILLLTTAFLGDEGIYNLGSSDTRTLLQIAEAVAFEVDVPLRQSSAKFESAPGAPQVVRMDTTKISSMFPRFEFTSLEVGLKQVVAIFRNALQKN
ncbi:MAG: NAD-dependent epimerase/dehydratase family protein [Actinobacteria bacterium]|uniref:Unannotated protein n=1 Tax=freshwater metagenome TaxID=449393 RepID=A0A6J6IZT0_9ZZZZ|nr:NAD-dependent epimerase/dehydratase family protein [Actinomycetota bacterium]